MCDPIDYGHSERVAGVVLADRLRLSHARTLQKLYLCRTNEKHLERQLETERRHSERLQARCNEMQKDVKRFRRRISPPVETPRGGLACSLCSMPVEAVALSEPLQAKYQFCRWCGARLRKA